MMITDSECKYCMTLLEMVGQHREAGHKIDGHVPKIETYEDLIREVEKYTIHHARMVRKKSGS